MNKMELQLHNGAFLQAGGAQSLDLGTYDPGGYKLAKGYNDLWLYVITDASIIGGSFDLLVYTPKYPMDIQTFTYNSQGGFVEKVDVTGIKEIAFTGDAIVKDLTLIKIYAVFA